MGVTTDDAVLIQNLQRGVSAAADELFHRHAGIAYRLALNYLENAVDAEDVVQTAFMQLLVSARREKITSVRAWLLKATVFACLEKLREEKRRRTREETVQQMTPAETAIDPEKAELISAVFDAMKGLPKHYRLPVSLHYLEGMPFKEIGDALSLSDATVRKQASLGIEQLRQTLTAAGFSASAIIIPELLASSPLPAAPTTLLTSLKSMLANVLAQGAGNGAAVASTIGKGAVAAAAPKVGVTVALLFVSAVTVATVFNGRGVRVISTKGDQPPTAAPSAGITAPPVDQSLAEILEKKIDANYRRRLLLPVLVDLNRRTGLQTALPTTLDFTFSLEEKQATVKAILERIAAVGNLDLEYHGDTVVLWKKSDDRILAELTRKLKDNDVESRCEAIYDLMQLGDKRIHPLICEGLNDKDEAVVATTVRQLVAHLETLRFGPSGPAIFDALVKLVSKPEFATYKSNILTIIGMCGDPRAANWLLSLLKNPDRFIRYDVTGALSCTHDVRVLDPLITLSKTTDRDTRAHIAGCLSGFDDPRAVARLVELSKDPEYQVSNCAIYSLSTIRDPVAIARLEELTHTKDEVYQNFAFHELGQILTLEQLLALAKSTNPNARGGVADALGEQRDSRATSVLLSLLHDPDRHVQDAAARALGNTWDLRAAGPLIAALTNASTSSRATIATSLGNISGDEAISELCKLSKDPDPAVRWTANYALGETFDPHAADALIAGLKDSNNDVRLGAITALNSILPKNAIESVRPLLKDTHPLVGSNAALFLSRTCEPGGMPLLIALTHDPDPRVRNSAVRAMELDTDNPRRIQPLIARLSDANEGVRSDAASALGMSLDPRARAPLIALLKDPSPDTRGMALSALEGNFKFDPVVKAALEEYRKTNPAQANPPPAKPSPESTGDF